MSANERDTTPKFQGLIEYIVRSIVDDPSQVEVTEIETERQIACEIHVAPGDMGHVIGKGGRAINAIRAVVRAAAKRHRKRASVEVIEPIR